MKKLILCAALTTQALFALTASADVYPQYYTTWQNGKMVVIFLQQAAFGSDSQTMIVPVCPDMDIKYPLTTPEIVQDETGFCVEFKATQI